MKRINKSLFDEFLFTPHPTWKGKVHDPKKMRYASTYSGSSHTSSYAKSSRQDSRQHCTVKVSYRMSKELHTKNLRYIQKEGKGIDGKSPKLYGNSEGYSDRMVDKNFRFIISPGNQDVELPILTEELIRRLECKTGYSLDWVAADHYDKPHKHTHILINGVDKNGKDIRFSREVISGFIRSTARDICTEMVGSRSRDEINNELSESVRSNRFVNLDRSLQAISENNTVTSAQVQNTVYGNHLHERLAYLCEINLCSFNPDNQSFTLVDTWDQTLKTYGKYSSYLEGFAVSRVSPDRYSLHEFKKDGSVEGTVLTRFYMQEDSSNHAVVLKKDDDSVVYVPLPVGLSPYIHNGETIRLEYRPSDRDNSRPGRVSVSKIK